MERRMAQLLFKRYETWWVHLNELEVRQTPLRRDVVHRGAARTMAPLVVENERPAWLDAVAHKQRERRRMAADAEATADRAAAMEKICLSSFQAPGRTLVGPVSAVRVCLNVYDIGRSSIVQCVNSGLGVLSQYGLYHVAIQVCAPRVHRQHAVPSRCTAQILRRCTGGSGRLARRWTQPTVGSTAAFLAPTRFTASGAPSSSRRG